MNSSVKFKDVFSPEIVDMLNRDPFMCYKCGEKIYPFGKCKCPIPEEEHCPCCGGEI